MAKPDSFQLEIVDRLSDITSEEWNTLLTSDAGPFLRHEFLSALEETGCVGGNTGWQVAHLVLRDDQKLIGAMPLYLKQHSYGEFVFDWSWAQAYEQQGMQYFPKALCAIPFTPVQGSRILSARNVDADLVERQLIAGFKTLVLQNNLSSAHVIFPHDSEAKGLKDQGFMLRDSVQFHWHNQGFENFEQFLAALTLKRRKNIRREREQVSRELITFRHVPGISSTNADWEFFYRCYENTYLEHGSSPYLNETFLKLWAHRLPENLHLIIAERNGNPIAASLLVVDPTSSKAYGRYWGAIEHVPCLHFETAYYQAIQYCISNQIQTFEGGAQGEHKMARGFLPTTIQSAHFIADPQFAKAVQHFLDREHQGIGAYVDELAEHSPLKSSKVQP
ncbi:GNAT family N-acetyltransferase [Polynucleobacter sp. JS-JIR-II-c23]|uniref:GNAT family N-acetyltransferase n=1 Tax=Polynucleobacter sp. JS-JIR-II-c23 TaxID=1758393 RepID=UPI002B23B71D|nr:GNAT family N-acetyltransferase [Polynucleobacter sp. JS-JIR-II-c23]MEA9604095.1 GNAT family N-acetyltransferase [Polynucleobacter sp. JS-JIR-II-c23]